MSWVDDLRRVTITVDGKQRNLIGASFRGVAFFVEASERSGGRRTVKHEFPFRDDPFYEDLGRRARTFRVDGYVIGADYIAQRDALFSAIEDEAGPGQLVHPYHGVRSAIGETVSCRESRSEGGFAAFSIEFCETPTQAPAPTVDVDNAGRVATSADAADAATDAELAEKYDPKNLPGFTFASAETALTNATDALNDFLGPVVTDTQEAAQLTGQAALITAEASSLVRTPADLIAKFRDTLGLLGNTILAAPGAVVDALLDAYDVDLGAPVEATTSTRQRESDNQAALMNALRRVMAIEAARLAPLVVFKSIEEAGAVRDRLLQALDEQAAAAGDTAYPALVDLRSELLHAVPGSSSLARIVNVSRASPLPSLLLAYQLYGSVDLEADIVARNAIQHPGFVVGDLKVLSDG